MDLFTAVYSIILIYLVKILYNYFTYTSVYWKKRGINGPTSLPILGNFYQFLLKPPNEVEEQNLLQYGRIYGRFEFSQPLLTIAEPSLIREFTIKHFHNFPNRYNRIPCDDFIAKTLFFMKDDSWKDVRSYMTPVFTTRKMKLLFGDTEKCVRNAIHYLISSETKELAIKEFVTLFTMSAILKSAFGCDTNPYIKRNNVLIEKVYTLTKFSVWRIFAASLIPSKLQRLHPLFKFSVIPENSIIFFRSILKSIVVGQKNNEVIQNDFVRLLLNHEQNEVIDNQDLIESGLQIEEAETLHFKHQSRKKLDEEEILAQCFLFFIAGLETSSTLLNFAIYALALNQNVQKSLYDEIKNNLNVEQEVDYDSLNSLAYLEAFVNESLRMYSPVVSIDRVAAEDIVLGENEVKIDKGTVVLLPIYAVHHDPLLFPEPHEFKPERFLPGNRHLIQPYSFMPFGVGPRNCIGMRFALMNIKLFLVHLLSKFQIMKSKNTPSKPKYNINFATLTAEPLYVQFVLREE